MPDQKILEVIPQHMAAPVKAAVESIRARRGDGFQVTGIVDPSDAFETNVSTPTELGLILCDGEICIREQVLLSSVNGMWNVSEVETVDSLIPAHLDPPEGIRMGWLQNQLAQYSFVLLLYYRGLW